LLLLTSKALPTLNLPRHYVELYISYKLEEYFIMNPADQWLAINAKYFPAEQVQYIRQRIEALPEAQVQLLYTLSFQDPTMMLVISLFGGSLGIDRFILGHVGLGVGKLLTGGGCGIWTIVDWFLIMDATRQANAQKLYSLIG
jgi:TM2 domain-containing membrane protein YozV